jgi:hypothetical protein
MPAWLPLLKASLPYVTQIVTAAIPHFTKKPVADQDVVPKQIAELQTAATQNAEAIKALAAQLKQTIEGIDGAAPDLQRELKGLRRLAALAVVLAVLATCVAVWALVLRPA